MPQVLSPREDTVLVLMTVLNGAPFLREQLDSVAAQSHVDWRLVASDDGSRDDSPQILSDFAAKHRGKVWLSTGPRRGFSRHFMQLLQDAPDVPYVALCDQDDVWRPAKLARAVAALQKFPADRPALYCARTTITREDLTAVRISDNFQVEPSFRNALVQNIGGGNTMVLNHAARQLAAAAAAVCPDPVAHDWWLYQIVTACGGVVVRDPEAVLLYRQHGSNLIGARLSAWEGLRHRLAILGGKWSGWNPQSLAALGPIRSLMTPDAQRVFDAYCAARHGPIWRRLRDLRASGVFRQNASGTLALYAMCALGRL